MGGAQATVSWSTDGLFSVMFPTGPGGAGRGGGEGEGERGRYMYICTKVHFRSNQFAVHNF